MEGIWDVSNPTVYIWFAGFVFVYFLPTIVAIAMLHKGWKDILFTNILIAWTIIGWFALFAWVADKDKMNG